jgi:UTP--glucose-1-phosphate uridylyltransferase
MAVIGRYVLHPEIFSALRATEPDAKGEIQLSDALKRVVDTDGTQGVLAQRFTGKRYDVGEKNGYLRATVELAAAREDLGPDFVDFLREFLTSVDGAEGGS